MPLWFCHRLSQEVRDDVRLVIVARDGSDISYWNPTTGTVFQEIEDVYAATGAPAADIFIWHQGETGETPDNTQYKTKWLAMRNALWTAGIIKNQAPCIVGGLQGVRIGGANDLYLQQLATENAGVYYADSSGLEDGGDGLHFAGPALYTFGYFRYWQQYRNHIGAPARKAGALRLTL